MIDYEIIEKLVEYIDEIDGVTIIPAKNFENERDPYMVLVGIEEKTQIYPTTPDYEYQISILIDTFIADDTNGKKIEEIKETIEQKLFPFVNRDKNLSEIFEDIPIVGFLSDGISDSISSESNRSELRYLIYASF